MYQDASNVLTDKLNDMRQVLSREIAIAARQAQGKLKKDILRVITLGGVGETSTKSTATAELRGRVKQGLIAMEEAWMKELESPNDLRSRNPFENMPIHGPDGEEDDDDRSDVSSNPSESESESSEEDNDDSDDSDFEG